jgi:N-acetylmuramoyl-L-alanine amidase
VTAPGYLPELVVGRWTDPVLNPVLGGVLAGRRIVVDAAGGGSEPLFVSTTGVRGSDTALEVARRLEVELRRAGALVTLTRSDDRTLPALARVEAAERLDADLMISVSADRRPGVRHYPGSDRGSRLAAAIGREIEIETGLALEPRSGVTPVLQQTSMPAVEVLLPVPADGPGEELHLDLDFARRLARALLLALAVDQGLDLATQGTALLTSPFPHLLLDGTIILPARRGITIVRGLEPGPAGHRAASLDRDGSAHAPAVFTIAPGDTARVGLP